MLTPEVRTRLAQEQFIWLTTQTGEGRPWSVPVWFVLEDDVVQIFSSPAAKKVGNLERNPLAAVHTNADAEGHDFIELKVEAAELAHGADPAAHTAYVDKYREAIDAFGIPLEDYKEQFSVSIRLAVTSAWVDG